MAYAGLGMAVVYIAVGVSLLIVGAELFEIENWQATTLGGLLIIYGIYRLFRHARALRAKQ